MKTTNVTTLLLSVSLAFIGGTYSFGQDQSFTTPNSAKTPDVTATQDVTATSAASADAPTASQHQVTYDPTDLNRAFAWTPEECDKALARGKEAAKKGTSLRDVLRDVIKQPVGVKGEKGKSHESSVVFTSLHAASVLFDSFRAATNYEPFKLPDSYKTQGLYVSQAEFIVKLTSVPVVTRSGRIRRTADADDVTVSKFVLTDDKGNIYYASNTESQGEKSGMESFSGVGILHHTDTAQVHTSTEATADGTGRFGSVNTYNHVNASGSSTSTGTYQYDQYIPWSQEHPYYEHTYTVDFALFDENGKPIIKNDVKKLTLHIIKPNGEQQVEYDLQR